ncbi:MAG TPA: response regulator transcription factor [Mycobacteriales bacterium]|nr:response regulator transcription factor [Mycobacteriales bacterium]
MSDITETCPREAPAVVVIDDDGEVRGLLQETLQLEGFAVRAAADGAEGLALIEEQRPDCVVLDLMMPHLDGHSVLRRLRERHGFGVPVIMLTAASDDDQAWQAWAGGVDCFMAKPFEIEELVHRVDTLSAASARDAGSGAPAAG